MTTPAEVLAAARDAINAVLPAQVRAYAADDIPATPPDVYVEVEVSRRFIDEARRSDGSLSLAGYRIGTRPIARLAVDARQAQADVARALDFVTLSFASGTSAVCEFETEDEVRPDDGWFSALTDWTVSV